MGERKGVNKWYPPDWRPELGGLNKYHGTHALRERARKLHEGILIIRFEMPYNIWCDGCGNHIGMGVRYNAEKKKIGMYYTTPLWQFRMKCHLCDNHFEIKTDPANLDYVVVSGARRQERRWDAKQNEQVVPEDRATSNKLASDAMFHLEHGSEDASKAKAVAPALKKLEARQDSKWKDDYLANRALRDKFRKRKKEAGEEKRLDEALLKKSSLDIHLLPESQEDSRLASLLQYATVQTSEERREERRQEIVDRPLFDTPPPPVKAQRLSKALQRSCGRGFDSYKSTNVSRGRLALGLKLKSEKEPSDDTQSQTSDPEIILLNGEVPNHKAYGDDGNNENHEEGLNGLADTSSMACASNKTDSGPEKEETKKGISSLVSSSYQSSDSE
ncbi:unnamed protein product [Darwinula stevensoni]|uniref:Coiled-coil domain-containing protein 130 n=1 Tax=Darwinula stevensoni TaxID=69355 RepID=A0A7R9A3M3_9CRUS|nr:unnamed protein product [Darwinula stevensoni]CAG0881647.1 unnamed protein product [Darwinula stevensoni]